MRLAGGPSGQRAGHPAEGTTPAQSSTCELGSPTRRSSRSSTCGAANSRAASESQDFIGRHRNRRWVIKRKLFQRYQGLMTWSCPAKIAQLDLAYHDIKRGRGIFDLLQRKGLARACHHRRRNRGGRRSAHRPRARLRGEFISAAQEAGTYFCVDWNTSQTQRPGAAHRLCAKTRSGGR